MYIFWTSVVSVIEPSICPLLILFRNIDPISKNQQIWRFLLEFGFTKRGPSVTIRVTTSWFAVNSVHEYLIKFFASNFQHWNVPYLIEFWFVSKSFRICVFFTSLDLFLSDEHISCFPYALKIGFDSCFLEFDFTLQKRLNYILRLLEDSGFFDWKQPKLLGMRAQIWASVG